MKWYRIATVGIVICSFVQQKVDLHQFRCRLFFQINMLYGTITEFCTEDKCPIMSAGESSCSILRILWNLCNCGGSYSTLRDHSDVYLHSLLANELTCCDVGVFTLIES